MIELIRTDSDNNDFINLVKNLDAELAIRDGKEHEFYAQFNQIQKIKYVILAIERTRPVACGAIKEYDRERMEVKRMFTLPEYRGSGIASKILVALENWAGEMGYKNCVLETGKKQPEAISLYKKNGYEIIPNYGQYKGVENSICFEKNISQ